MSNTSCWQMRSPETNFIIQKRFKEFIHRVESMRLQAILLFGRLESRIFGCSHYLSVPRNLVQQVKGSRGNGVTSLPCVALLLEVCRLAISQRISPTNLTLEQVSNKQTFFEHLLCAGWTLCISVSHLSRFFGRVWLK